MFKRIIQAASLFGFLALAACSADTSDEGSQTDQELVAAPGPGEEGGICGGIAGFTCKDGLRCSMSGKGDLKTAGVPSPGGFPDQSGVCVRNNPRPGELGGLCGGIAGIACHAGLTCQYGIGGVKPAGLPGDIIADESGICMAAGGFPPGAVGMPILN
jgi:hypothetical protein